MSTRILAITIIFFSLISGAIGSTVFLYFSQSDSSSYTQNKTHTPIQIKKVSQGTVSLQEDIHNIVADVSPSVVSIIVKKDLVIYRSDPWGFFQRPSGTIRQKIGWWSGFFISKDGIILTNKHVVLDKNAEYTVILSNGSEYDAKVLALDPINDLAVIKIDSLSSQNKTEEFQALSFIQDSDETQIGDFAIAIWNALAEFQNSVSLGIISWKDRVIEASWERLSGLLQTDAAINPWNSWGPLINLNGEIIWINTAIVSWSNGIGFSIALSQDKVDYMLSSIKKYGTIKRPFIGINYIQNSPGVAKELWLYLDYGAYIIDEENSIVAWSSADESGLEPGDIISEVNGVRLSSKKSLENIIRNSIPGDVLSLKVMKKSGKEENIDLELGAY